jgi:hypothetical protein
MAGGERRRPESAKVAWAYQLLAFGWREGEGENLIAFGEEKSINTNQEVSYSVDKQRLVAFEESIRNGERIDWLKLGDSLDIVSLKILEKVYFPESKAFTLDAFYKQLGRINVSKETIRTRLLELEKLKLLQLIRGNPMAIWGIHDMELLAKDLVKYGYSRFGVVSRWGK